jgi:radical SAM superfamily enzyme YgiQ (UPF0313 family)
MARVLLINSNRFMHPWPVIPFGVLYVATSLEKKGNEVSFLDLCFSDNCEGDILKSIIDSKPDVIGISIRNIDDTGGYNVHFLLQDVKDDVIDHCKKYFNGPIVIGGPSVGISGPEMLEFFDLEYAIRGDGEAVMPEFVACIDSKQSPEGLSGLIIRRNKKIIQDDEPYRIKDLDALPFPEPLHFLNLDRYKKFGSPIHIQTKRGCALRCSYCTYNKIEGKKYRLRTPGLVADEIETLVRETGIDHVEFTDSIFNIPLNHAKEVLKELIGKKLNLRLHTMGLSPAAIDDELLDLMKTAGFNEVDIGAESLNDKILKSLAKDFTCKEIISSASLLQRRKIPVTWFIMLGAPEETRDTVRDTLETIAKLVSRWDLVFISTGIRVYNGAPFADEIIKKSMYCTDDNFLHPVKIEPEQISLEEIHSIAKEYSFRFPNFYFYEKEHIIPAYLLLTGNFILKFFRSKQPVWRMLIFLRMIKKWVGISFIQRVIYTSGMTSHNRSGSKLTGFSLVNHRQYPD